MADNDNGIEGRPPDPFVAARVNDPGTPAPASFELAGLLGDSDRDGYRRLYLNTSLDYYVEFRTEDVLTVESVTPDQPPFVGLDATRVTLNRDAQVAYVHSRPAAASDAFNLDAQSGLPGGFTPDTDTGTLPTDLTNITIRTPGCVPRTVFVNECWHTQIGCFTRGVECITQKATCFKLTCQTCDQATCHTCVTCQTCDQATCATCNQATCQTCNNGVTCQTCIAAVCWPTLNGTCQTCRITDCDVFCQSQLVPCITKQRCPTVPACP